MKIYTRCVIDIKTGEVEEEEFFEYEGEVALCGGSGGGSGGGGGGSGRVDYPPYMKEAQADWIGGGEPDGSGLATLSSGNDITSVMDSAIGASPFSGLSAYNPDTRITNMETALDDYESYINSIETTEGVETELAKFDAGMRNINAVISSSFAIGRQHVASGLIEAKLQAKGQLASLKSEVQRQAIVAKSEETNTNRKIDEQDALWDLEVFQAGGNVLASIGGGTVQKKGEEPSQLQSALGGAMSGAATGAMVGSMVPGVGTAVGAGAGAALGAGASLL